MICITDKVGLLSRTEAHLRILRLISADGQVQLKMMSRLIGSNQQST
ncbi:hypothetical protein CRUP_021582 [Coryphaenoides rupestris]|nr:hypothetical protein CRUP_021582 [Coryphaenoides rupestris]